MVTEFKNYIPPSFDELFMREVYLIASKSKDPMTKIGAVLVKDNHSILRGYNGIVQGVKDLPERMERPEKYDWMSHAERNVFYLAARLGISSDRTTLYTQGLPCCQCADGVIQSGIEEIVLHKQWEDLIPQIKANNSDRPWTEVGYKSGVKFYEAGITIRFFDKFLNVDGYWDGKKFQV
jgi:dCMP deaminase